MNLSYLDCLDGLIGYRGECSPVTPSSGIYLNDFPAMKIEALNAGVDAEMQNAFDLLDSKINIAKLAVANDVINSLRYNQRAYSLIEGDVAGRYQDNMPTLAAENGYYKGIQIYSMVSPYTEIYLSEIALQTQHTGDVDVKVWDLLQNKLLDTFTVPCVSGEISRVTVNKGYLNRKQRISLFIGYESNIAAYQSWVSPSGCVTCNPYYGNRYVRFTSGKIATGAQKISSNVQSIDSTAGLSITYEMNCALEPVVCQAANLLAYPLAFKAMNEVMKEMKYSKRLNSIITVYRTDHKELADEYQLEYERALKNVMENYIFQDNICYPCQPRVKIVTRIP